MLKPLAHKYGVDPAGDHMRPGNSSAEKAFQLLKCGTEMLLYVADHAFPTIDRRSRRNGPKWIRQGILFTGRHGSLLFGRAAPLLLAKMDGRVSGDEPPELTVELHRALYDMISSFYPFPKANLFTVDELMGEYTVMEKHLPRKEVLEGEHRPNAYSEALMRDENPDDDPELVAMQRDYARDFFIDTAIHLGVGRSLDKNDRKILKHKFVRFPQLREDAAAEVRARNFAVWIDGTKPYLEYARLCAQEAGHVGQVEQVR